MANANGLVLNRNAYATFPEFAFLSLNASIFWLGVEAFQFRVVVSKKAKIQDAKYNFRYIHFHGFGGLYAMPCTIRATTGKASGTIL